MRTSEHISDLAKSLAKAQGLFTAAERAHVAKVLSKKGEGSSYSYNYADLAAYLDVCREPLSQSGLSFVQLPTVKGDEVAVVTILMHESGQFIESDPLCLTAEHDQGRNPTPQAIGSAITYARRYSLSAVTGMASEADDDGSAASGIPADTGRRQEKPNCPGCGKNTFVYEDKRKGGFFCWNKPDQGKHGCGHNWNPELPPVEPTDEQKTKAKEIAAQHGMTTGDKLKPSETFTKAIKAVEKAVRERDSMGVATVVNLADQRLAEGKLTQAEHTSLQNECTLALKKIKALEKEPEHAAA